MPGGFVLKTTSIYEVQSQGIQMTCLLGPSHGMSTFNSFVLTHTCKHYLHKQKHTKKITRTSHFTSDYLV